MSSKRTKFNRDRVTSLLEVGRRVVLSNIFTWGTPSKPPTTPLDQYLANLPQNSTANFPRVSRKERNFNATELQQIQHDSSCVSFDTSLLWKVIKLACDGVANYDDSSAWKTPSARVEYYATAIKDERNDSMHGAREITTQEFLDTATRLRKLFHDALVATKKRFKRPDAELASKIQEVNDEFDKVMLEVLGEEDLLAYRESHLKQDLIQETNEVLKKYFQNSINIDPMSFLTGIKLHLYVQKVFTEIKVTRGRVRGEQKGLRYQDLVEAARTGPNPALPQVLLVEGVAGSGKTTFVTLVTDEWLKDAKARTITGLDYYDLLLRVQCRERTITSLDCLFENEVSQMFLKYRKFVIPLMKKCKILILIDGLDESNEDSKKLIEDILTQMKTVNGCTLLFTSRPEGITNFIGRIPQEYQVSHIHLIGIPESHREVFVRRYHEEIKQQIGDTQDTEKLVEKVRQVLEKEHFRLPLNMVFLTWVYIHDPSAITSTTTQTQLYYSTYQLCLQKLLDRLARHSTTRSSDRRILETHIKQPMKTLQYESLSALWRSQLSFEAEAEDRIRVSCNDKGIPHEELLSAFLTLKSNRTHLGIIVEQYSAPHKGLQEFYAALHITNHERLATSASVRGVLEEALGEPNKNLSRLQNVLYHAAGLLHLLPKTVFEEITREIVDLLSESGMSRERWLDFAADTRANPVVLRQMVPHFTTTNILDFVEEIPVTEGAGDKKDKEENEQEEGEDKGMADGKIELEEWQEDDAREMEMLSRAKRIMKKIKVKSKNEEENSNKKEEGENGKKETTEKESDKDDSNLSYSKGIRPVLIQDSRVDIFLVLLPLLPPCGVELDLYRDPGPRMVDLLNVMKRHVCVSLELMYHIVDPDPTATSDHILRQVLPRSRLEMFAGHLTEDCVPLLPRSLNSLSLILTSDDHALRILKALHSVYCQLSSLKIIRIYVSLLRVTPSVLIPVLPDDKEMNIKVNLILSDVNDSLIKKTCRVAKALQCSRGCYDDVRFPRASASFVGWRDLLKGLAKACVWVRDSVGVGDISMDDKMKNELQLLARKKLNCEFYIYPDRWLYTAKDWDW